MPSGKALTATKELGLDYFLRTVPPREEEARGAEERDGADERAEDEWTADERGVDERVVVEKRGNVEERN